MKDPAGYVLDASVLVAGIHSADQHHAEARTALSWVTQRKAPIYLPAIALSEIAAAIARGTGDSQQAKRDVNLIHSIPGMEFVAVDVELGAIAAEIAGDFRIRGCDAVYVALAQVLDVALITLDRQQRQRTPTIVASYTPGELSDQLGLP